MRVFETFTSLQGESSFAGEICFFIRLAGCNLDCSYCDTRPARRAAAGREQGIADLLAAARASGARLAEVTGGEPLLQPETPELLQALLDAGFTVELETNGSVDLARVPAGVRRIIDYKLPSSGMRDFMRPENFRGLTGFDEVKFVIGSRADYEFMKNLIAELRLDRQPAKLLYSPVWGAVNFQELAEWIIADRLPGKMQLQLHKLIWGADATGV